MLQLCCPTERRFCRVRLLAIVFLGIASSLCLQAQSVPSGGTSLIDVADLAIHGDFWSGSNGGLPIASRTTVPVTGQSFTQAARINVERPDGQFFSTGILARNNRAVEAGDVVLMHFFLRAIETTDESGSVFVEAYAEGPDFAKSMSHQASAATEWVEYFLPFEVIQDYPVGQLSLVFGLGSGNRPSVFEIGGAEVIWYGKSRTLEEMPRTSFNYDGRASNAPWRAQAAARIEQYRKADYAIRVVDSDGRPMSGATVRVKLRRHAFEFGTAVVASRIMDRSSDDSAKYRETLLKVFNAASPENDLKWPALDGEWGPDFNLPQTLEALHWLRIHDFSLRGHVLVWPSRRNLPESIHPLLAARDPSVPDRVRSHITEVVTATNEVLEEWDVLNEPYDNHDLMDIYGEDEMASWFDTARAAHPQAKLYINDYGILSGGGLNTAHQDHYEQTIRTLVESGAPIDGIGMQGHFSASPTGIPKVWSILERFANAFPGLSIRITEFDVGTDDEDLQGDYTRDFLTLAFSHPAVVGFQLWGFWDGAIWREQTGLYRRDWSEKPNGAAFRQLIHEVWQTDHTRTSGGDGRVSGRGFLGRYEATVTVGGRTLTQTFQLPAEGVNMDLVFSPDAVERRLVNLSTRGPVGAGDGIMIAGFVLSGDGEKEVLIRGIGPKLQDFGLEAVANPVLEVFRANDQVRIAGNDDWPESLGDVFGRAGAFELTGDTRSAALRLRLPAGGYTVQLSNAGTGSGVGIVEVYDLASNEIMMPANLSTRSLVGTGDRMMIAGFVIAGDSPRRVLIRGVGPGLAEWLEGYLVDPQLVLKRQSDAQTLASNDDWEVDGDAAEIAKISSAVGAFPLAAGSKDAVILTTLPAGNYSVQLSGANGTSGIGMIEVYAAD